MIQPSPGIERVIQDKGTHIMATPNQGFREMRADKAVGTGYQYIIHCLHHIALSIR